MTITTDENHPDLNQPKENGQNKAYLVLSDEEKAKGFIRPLRTKYIHTKCGVETKMHTSIAETYAREPRFYGATFCVKCKTHYPVSQFTWSDGTGVVGS